jgi:transposase-like protein
MVAPVDDPAARDPESTRKYTPDSLPRVRMRAMKLLERIHDMRSVFAALENPDADKIGSEAEQVANDVLALASELEKREEDIGARVDQIVAVWESRKL